MNLYQSILPAGDNVIRICHPAASAVDTTTAAIKQFSFGILGFRIGAPDAG
jgi:hypothetical protein